MLTNTLLALKATLSHNPDTKQHAIMGASECAGSMSSLNVVSHPAFGDEAFSGGGVRPCESVVETRALTGFGVLAVDSLRAGVSVSAPMLRWWLWWWWWR